jgi:hypothetical protein
MRGLIKAGISAVVLSLGLAAPVAAGPFEDGTAAYNGGRSGLRHGTGRGVPQDHAAAADWYRKAADQGYAIAQNNLGVRYQNGWGVPRDFVSALMFFNLAAAGGFNDAAQNRDLLAAKMTRAQIAEAESRATAWRPSKTANVQANGR